MEEETIYARSSKEVLMDTLSQLYPKTDVSELELEEVLEMLEMKAIEGDDVAIEALAWIAFGFKREKEPALSGAAREFLYDILRSSEKETKDARKKIRELLIGYGKESSRMLSSINAALNRLRGPSRKAKQETGGKGMKLR